MGHDHYDCHCHSIRQFADEIETDLTEDWHQDRNIKERKWFKKLLNLCADAGFELEGVDSGDCSEKVFLKSLSKIKSFVKRTVK